MYSYIHTQGKFRKVTVKWQAKVMKVFHDPSEMLPFTGFPSPKHKGTAKRTWKMELKLTDFCTKKTKVQADKAPPRTSLKMLRKTAMIF